MNILTTAEAAERLGVSVRQIQAFCMQGRLGQKVGRTWIITESDLRRFERKPRPVGNPRLAAQNRERAREIRRAKAAKKSKKKKKAKAKR